ncbi:hypothetical protein AMJ86_06245 [bacterium SM23_57]|nr:MAG: hypothetical protein AMJ86_06245 [bacterium SM23_57]
MRVLCFDPVNGAAGDMILGSLLDLGVPVEEVDKGLRSTGISGFTLQFRQEEYAMGILAGKADVQVEESHHHRHLGDIVAVIEKGDYSQRVKDRALAVFRRLAEAEAAVHRIAVEKVHFHEVGAVDAIVDILGTAIALEYLDVDGVYCGPIAIGMGSVVCAHGNLPVPAPATVELLIGHPTIRKNVEHELTTPTGAAILTALTKGDWSGRPMVIQEVGTGRGSKDVEGIPNVFRAFLADMMDVSAHQEVDVIESDIDDDTAEVTSELMQVLREAGALDVTVNPVIMKKGRQGFRLTVVCSKGDAGKISNVIFTHSSTIGVRFTGARRFVLPRERMTVKTKWGEIRAKRITRPDRVEIVPEFEECKRIAREHSVSIREVMQEVILCGE